MLFPSLARRVMRRARTPRAAAAILMYHRVADVQYDPWNLAVSPENFEQQLAYLKRHHTPMPLNELIEALQTGKLPHNAVAITFDDGYRDNLVNARPLLLRHGLPATLFLATGWVGSSVPFWWDELAEFTLGSVDRVIHTDSIDGETFTLDWGLPEAADLSFAWRASEDPQTGRQKAYVALWRKLQRSSQAERTRVMNSFRACFRARRDSLSMPMDASEIRELIEDDLITLGAHTVHHPALTQLSAQECRDEILTSAEQCSTLSGAKVSGFAYPYGDVNGMVRNVVVEAGLSWACSTRAAHLTNGGQDVHALPRLAIPNCTMNRYAELLSG